MEKKPRKPRSDSITHQLRLRAGYDGDIEPSSDLDPDQRAVFDELIVAMPSIHWQPHLVREATRLARLECVYDALVITATNEGPVLIGKQGGKYQNPNWGAMTSLSGTIKQMRGMLGVNPASTSQTREASIHADRESAVAATTAKQTGNVRSLLS